jgi:hypothetical protein
MRQTRRAAEQHPREEEGLLANTRSAALVALLASLVTLAGVVPRSWQTERVGLLDATQNNVQRDAEMPGE